MHVLMRFSSNYGGYQYSSSNKVSLKTAPGSLQIPIIVSQHCIPQSEFSSDKFALIVVYMDD